MKKTTICCALVSILAVCALTDALASPGAERPSRVVVVIAGDLSIRDVADPGLANLGALLRGGCAALVNVRTGRPSKDTEPTAAPGMEAGCVSLGAGAMAVGGAEAGRASDAACALSGLNAGELYESRTGHGFQEGNIVHPEIAKLQRANLASSYHAAPGALGSALHAAGIKTAVLGSSDLPGEAHREAVAMAMDREGLVDYGEVSSPALTRAAANSPYGVVTNTDFLLREIDKNLSMSRFIVVDFGDTLRADRYADLCTEACARRVRRQAAVRLDEFVGRLARRMDFTRDLLVVISPSSRLFSDIDGELLTPVIIRGPGFTGGLLTSPSTRTRGVVTVSDVAPSILAFFNITAPREIVGRPVRSVPNGLTADILGEMNLRASLQAERQVGMRGASVVQSVVVVLLTAMVLLGASGVLRKLAGWAALIPAAIPIAMLYVPLLYNGGLVGSVLCLIALTIAVLVLFACLFRSPYRALIWLCGATILSLAFDLMRGGPLIASTMASYSLVEGARYYGMGNELMGTILGASLIGTGMAVSLYRLRGKLVSLAVAAVFALAFISIGAPGLGANAGGAMAAAPAIAVVLLARWGWKPNWRSAAFAAVFTVVVVAALFAVDAGRGGASQTHMGRAMTQTASGGFSGLVQIAQRKIALNFMLLSTSLWSRLLGLSLLGSALIFWRECRLTPKFLDSHEAAAALACVIGTAGAFAFNDSGVVAAATCVVFLWMFLVVKVTASRDKASSKRAED